MLPKELVISQRVIWREENERVVLLAPRFGKGWMDRILRKLFGALTVTVKLDELGSFVWKCCNGSTSLDRIVAAFEETFQGDTDKAEERIEIFLTELHRQGWISFSAPGATGGDPGAED